MENAVSMVLFVAMVMTGEASTTQRIYTITTGRNYGAQYYWDDAGMSVGFVPELVAEVCREAGIQCVTTRANNDVARCWSSSSAVHQHGGRGLHGRMYDGCTARDPTIERIHTFAFSLPYARTALSVFFFLKGKNFDSRDLANKNIGFLEGWSSNEKCVARADHLANNMLTKDQIFIFRRSDALSFLHNGTVDAIFGDNSTYSRQDLIDERLEVDKRVTVQCFLGGHSVMARKDSTLIANWNVGFRKLVNSGRYRELCEEAERRHGHRGELNCLDV